MLTPEILSGLFGQPRSEGAILVGEPLFFQDFLREFYTPSPANNPSENFFHHPTYTFLVFSFRQPQSAKIAVSGRLPRILSNFVRAAVKIRAYQSGLYRFFTLSLLPGIQIKLES